MKDKKFIQDRIKALNMALDAQKEKEVKAGDWKKNEIDSQIEFEELSKFENKLDEVEDISHEVYVDKAFDDEDKENEFFEDIKEASDTINSKKKRYQKQKLEDFNKGIYKKGGLIKVREAIEYDNNNFGKRKKLDLEKGSRNWQGLYLDIQPLVWARNFQDGYNVSVYEPHRDYTKKHLGTLNIDYSGGSMEIREESFAKGGLTPAKAQKMLEDGEANGKPLTDKQKRYFKQVCSQCGKKDCNCYSKGGELPSPAPKIFQRNLAKKYAPNLTGGAATIIEERTGMKAKGKGIDSDSGRELEKGGKVSSGWDNFFEANPEKILGTATKVKTKFGKEAIVIKGDISSLELIDVPNYEVDLAENFNQSSAKEEVSPNTMTEENRKAAKHALDKDEQTYNVVRTAEEEGRLDEELYTFDEVDEKYNGVRKDKQGNIIAEAITDIEKCAYVYYIETINDKKIIGGFTKYRDIYSLSQMIDKGEIFYDYSELDPTKRYQPKFFFASGNITDKKIALENNKDEYIKLMSKRNYDLASAAIEEAFQKVYSKRLSLDDPDEKMRLQISLHSKIAKTFKVKGIIDPITKKLVSGFNCYVSKTQYGDIKSYEEWLCRDDSDNNGNNRHYFNELSIAQAFFVWLRYGSNDWNDKAGIRYTAGVSCQSLLKIYFRHANMPKRFVNVGEDKKKTKQRWLRFKGKVKDDAERLFAQFLANGLETSDRRQIENDWNRKLNSHLDYDPNRVPIGFRFTKFFGEGIVNDIRPEKREAIAYYMMRGSCLFAYGVGIGKTWCSIFTIAQVMEMGLAKRPLISVPKQVYPQFVNEINLILGGNYPVNTLYNCSDNIDITSRKSWFDKAYSITDYSISICTYQGFYRFGFSENYDQPLIEKITMILNEGDDSLNARQQEKLREKMQKILGIGLEGAAVYVDDEKVNFDFLCFDEAHNAKKVFVDIKGELVKQAEDAEKIQRTRVSYEDKRGGAPSTMGIKLFFLTQFIQNKTRQGNCLLMTATPFTNSPLEVYSILSLINHNYLQRIGFSSVRDFYDTYADMQSRNVVRTNLSIEKKQVFVGWKNLVSMQDIVHSLIDKKNRAQEDLLVERPNKIVLPYRSVMKDGENYPVAKKNRVSTTLSMNDTQEELKDYLMMFANMKESPITELPYSFAEMCDMAGLNKTKYGKLFHAKTKATEETIDEGDADTKQEGAGIRALRTLSYFRHLALNPYLYSCSGYEDDPTPSEFIDASPKMLYVMECIKSVKKYEEDNNLPISGQVIYMGQLGTDAFPLMAKYIVDELGYKENEVGYISGSDSRVGKKKYEKDEVQDAFLGRKFNEQTTEYEDIPDDKRLKILIGSNSIREGMNLQFHASVLYNLYLDFNPTDNTQLEGRIWRQGNRFDNVRIVVPLLENSMDIFMFQKLEEKTERINQIWNRDGKTNELNTEDFSPSELKMELISDPKQVAEMEVEELEKEIMEEIDDVNREYVKFRNFEAAYENYKEFYNTYPEYLHNNRGSGVRLGAMYHFLRAMRPDLVPLNLIKNTEQSVENYRNSTRPIQPETLNYTLDDLIEKLVQLHKDKKVAYPENYTSDWEDLVQDADYDYQVGDKVEFTTKRGRKKKGVVVDKNSGFNEADIQVGEDEDNVFEEIQFSSMELIKDKPEKKAKKEKLKPFAWGSKEWKDKIKDISDYQQWTKENMRRYTFDGGREANNSQFADPKTNAFNYTIQDYVSNTDLLDLPKWIDFQEYMKNEAQSSSYYSRGYKTGVSGYNSEPFWDLEYPLMIKNIKKAEKEVLRPLGINNLQDLENKIKELKTEKTNLETKAKELSDPANIEVRADKIAEQKEKELKEGIRTASNYKNRAAEFASSNPDYKGNDYLLILSEKYLVDKITDIEELKETDKYLQLTTKEQKKLIKKFKEKQKKKKSKAKPTKDNAIEILETRIKAMSMIVAVKKGKDKKKAQDRIKTLKMTLSFKKGK